MVAGEKKDDFMNISPDDICTCITDYAVLNIIL